MYSLSSFSLNLSRSEADPRHHIISSANILVCTSKEKHLKNRTEKPLSHVCSIFNIKTNVYANGSIIFYLISEFYVMLRNVFITNYK